METEVEAYIMPGMSVSLLLGEDYQVNYEISVHRSVNKGCYLDYGRSEQFKVKAVKVEKNKAFKQLIASTCNLQSFVKARNHH